MSWDVSTRWHVALHVSVKLGTIIFLFLNPLKLGTWTVHCVWSWKFDLRSELLTRFFDMKILIRSVWSDPFPLKNQLKFHCNHIWVVRACLLSFTGTTNLHSYSRIDQKIIQLFRNYSKNTVGNSWCEMSFFAKLHT